MNACRRTNHTLAVGLIIHGSLRSNWRFWSSRHPCKQNSTLSTQPEANLLTIHPDERSPNRTRRFATPSRPSRRASGVTCPGSACSAAEGKSSVARPCPKGLEFTWAATGPSRPRGPIFEEVRSAALCRNPHRPFDRWVDDLAVAIEHRHELHLLFDEVPGVIDLVLNVRIPL